MTGQDLLKHMGVYILNDPKLHRADNPCGLCLNTGQLCEIFLLHWGGAISIDQTKSHCPNIHTLQIKKVEEFTPKQPCTNHPLLCSLCPCGASAVWKYNLYSHILQKYAWLNTTLYKPIWRLYQDKELLIKAKWEKLKCYQTWPSKETTWKLKTSDGYSLHLAFTVLINFIHIN